MNILVTTPTYPPYNSGLGNAVQQQVVSLKKHGCEVVVATGGSNRGRREDPLSGAAVEEFAVRGSDSLLQPLRGDVAGYLDFLRTSDFDVVLLNAWQTWSTDVVLKNLSSIPGRKYLYSNCVSTNLILKKQPVRSALRYLAWRPYWMRMPGRMRKLDGLVFVADQGCDSRFDDLRLAQKLGVSHVIIPNAFSGFCTQEGNDSNTVPLKRHQLIAVGSYDWFKGHDFSLRAYALSEAKNRIPLKIFGSRFTAYTDQLRSLTSDLGLDANLVTFHQETEKSELLDEYRCARILISGSHTECQPLVLLDAMATGTPFVARSCGCIPSLSGGIVVRSEKDAAQAINRILGDDREWDSLNKEGRLAAGSNHRPDVVGAALAAFLARPGRIK
jgi:glycosyltransferase involved in cell wall biosynthesis